MHKLKSHIRKECKKRYYKGTKTNVCLKGFSTVSEAGMNVSLNSFGHVLRSTPVESWLNTAYGSNVAKHAWQDFKS